MRLIIHLGSWIKFSRLYNKNEFLRVCLTEDGHGGYFIETNRNNMRELVRILTDNCIKYHFDDE